MKLPSYLFLAIALAPFAILNAGGDETAGECGARGKQVYEKCAVCHSLDPEEGHGVAPNLFGILGKPIGKQEGFKYSRTMRKSELTWTEEHMKTFIESPMQVHPGTSMAFAGLKKEDDRDELVCYLAEHQ